MSKISNNLMAVSMYAVLAGCTADNAQTEYSTDRVMTDQYGLVLKPSNNMYIGFERMSEAYTDTMACMGMTAAGPTVEYRSFSFSGLGGAWALYVPVESTILINTDEDDVLRKRDSRTDLEALQHEFIHHLLHRNGAGEQSRGHASPLFKQCGLGVKSSN